MNTKIIYESGMYFGPYNIEDLFYIEKSNIYEKIKNGVKIAEFVLLKKEKHTLFIIEAKQSSPKFTEENRIKCDKFINDIVVKFINTLSLTFAACLQRQKYSLTEFPKSFQEIDLKTIDVKFLLILNGHDKAWLPPLQEALSKKMNPFVAVWAFSSADPVLVLNETMAIKYNIIERFEI